MLADFRDRLDNHIWIEESGVEKLVYVVLNPQPGMYPDPVLTVDQAKIVGDALSKFIEKNGG
jgi:hypothetical protein